MIYVDTSVLVAALTNESQTGRMQAWLGRQAADELGISEWVATEFSAALSMKVCGGFLDQRQRADVLAKFTTLVTDTFVMLPIAATQFRTAARFANHMASDLRAADALHLAIVADHGASLATLDRQLAKAATLLGVSVRAF